MSTMQKTEKSKLRFIPLLMITALVAFSLRIAEVYTGLELMNTPVQAQDQEASESKPADEEEAGNNDNAIAEVETPKAPIVVGLPDSEEMELITQLRERRVELEGRATQLDLQARLLESTEQRINEKIVQLEKLEERIKSHLRLFEEKETEQLQSIVSIYETMKPKQAAPRFEALSLQTQLDLVQLMSPRKVAALMEKMTAKKASVLTTELATKAQPPSINDIQGEGR